MNAKGFFFITLEDETGFANLIITPQLFEQHRVTLIGSNNLWSSGIVQSHQGVVHLKCREIRDLQDAVNLEA